jgi:hypothetical protein
MVSLLAVTDERPMTKPRGTRPGASDFQSMDQRAGTLSGVVVRNEWARFMRGR